MFLYLHFYYLSTILEVFPGVEHLASLVEKILDLFSLHSRDQGTKARATRCWIGI